MDRPRNMRTGLYILVLLSASGCARCVKGASGDEGSGQPLLPNSNEGTEDTPRDEGSDGLLSSLNLTVVIVVVGIVIVAMVAGCIACIVCRRSRCRWSYQLEPQTTPTEVIVMQNPGSLCPSPTPEDHVQPTVNPSPPLYYSPTLYHTIHTATPSSTHSSLPTMFHAASRWACGGTKARSVEGIPNKVAFDGCPAHHVTPL